MATDLSNAFDSVSHSLLLNKLQNLGLHMACTSWIASYLSNRSQTTKFAEIESDKEIVQSGVPQGSILGPVLFIAFTTDLAKDVPDCKFVAYADDAVLLVSSNTLKQLKQKIEVCVGKVQKWYTENGLLINSDKTEFMIMKQRGTHNITIKTNSKDINIESKQCLKILGMKFSPVVTGQAAWLQMCFFWRPSSLKILFKTRHN